MAKMGNTKYSPREGTFCKALLGRPSSSKQTRCSLQASLKRSLDHETIGDFSRTCMSECMN